MMYLSALGMSQSVTPVDTLSMAASVATILGVVIALVGAYIGLRSLRVTLASLNEATEKFIVEEERRNIENAIALAKAYQEQIQPSIDYISELFALYKLDKLTKETLDQKYDAELVFNSRELNALSKSTQFKCVFEERYNQISPYEIIHLYKAKFQTLDFLETQQEDTEEARSEFNHNPVRIRQADELLTSQIVEVLNKLEWFAMNFHKDVAAEEAIYQSFHISYLAGVKSLYYFIAINNERAADKMFVSIIWLFQQWSQRLAEIQAEELKANMARKKANEQKIEEIKRQQEKERDEFERSLEFHKGRKKVKK